MHCWNHVTDFYDFLEFLLKNFNCYLKSSEYDTLT